MYGAGGFKQMRHDAPQMVRPQMPRVMLQYTAGFQFTGVRPSGSRSLSTRYCCPPEYCAATEGSNHQGRVHVGSADITAVIMLDHRH